MLRDILSGKDDQVGAVLTVIDGSQADILVLQDIDFDHDLLALHALNGSLKHPFPEVFALAPNSGQMTSHDLDGDGRTGGPGDAQGYGRFFGDGGMAILSRFPIKRDEVIDMKELLWKDMPDPRLPLNEDGTPFPSAETIAHQRLSSKGHWMVPITVPGGLITVITAHPSPPVFDGPEDRNGKRNADENALLGRMAAGEYSPTPPENPVVLGDLNLDPFDGDGMNGILNKLLATGFQDPMPSSEGATMARLQGGANLIHTGNAAQDTVDWRDDPGPGNLRVDYALPSKRLQVVATGVYWPEPGAKSAEIVELASRHRLVWVDVLVE